MTMPPLLAFGLGVLMNGVGVALLAALFAWPWLKARRGHEALTWLVAPHTLIRFLGLGFLVPGVVSASLPRAWALPAAYGDLGAGVLAIVATVALARRLGWALPAVWIFNLWGAADLLFAFFEGSRAQLEPGALGAAFYVVTGVVPLLLISHALIFRLLTTPSPAPSMAGR
ncbi:MAG TPA: hypothetical protein VMB50_24765 [Myxococcales bacterium]|nr:hypothetical protein [Myxococcales bacterium]